MIDKNLLTVAEFAELAGITKQAVYKQISGKLKEYVQLIDNQKMIQKDALELYTNNTENNDLSTMIKLLSEQLNTKDEEIKRLHEQIVTLNTLLLQEQQLRAGAMKKQLEAPQPERKGFFSRLFK